MTDSVVEVHELARQFGKTMGLDGVSLQVQPGFVYGLVGANGAGKTTLMKHLLDCFGFIPTRLTPRLRSLEKLECRPSAWPNL